jgi:hypothetical protein
MVDRVGPKRWAADLTVLLNALTGRDRFPIDVEAFALAYSQQRWPDEPILEIVPADIPTFEGAIIPKGRPRRGWGILLNESVAAGRRRFTTAHEFGHYLLHRSLMPEGIYCDEAALRGDESVIEREADQFAAAFLMPLDDLRCRIAPREKPTLDALGACADRYGVSLTAVVLRWLEYTERRALIVVSREGFALWARSSSSALRSGRFIRSTSPPFELPAQSCAVLGLTSGEARNGIVHPAGVWFPEPVEEVSIVSERHEQVISILHLGDLDRGYHVEEAEVEDAFDRLSR